MNYILCSTWVVCAFLGALLRNEFLMNISIFQTWTFFSLSLFCVLMLFFVLKVDRNVKKQTEFEKYFGKFVLISLVTIYASIGYFFTAFAVFLSSIFCFILREFTEVK